MSIQNKKTKQIIIAVIIFSCLVLLPVKAAHAQFVVTDVPMLGKTVAETIKAGWKTFRDNALALAYKNLLGTFLQQMAYDMATEIATTGQGQTSLVYDKPAGEYFKDIGDQALGAAVEGFAEGVGISAGLCTMPNGFLQTDIAFGLMTQFGGSSATRLQPDCTLSELAGNWGEAFEDPEFDMFLNAYWDPQSNSIGSTIMTIQAIKEEQDSQIEAASWDRLFTGGEYKAVQDPISKIIQTPASSIESLMERPLVAEENVWGQYTNSVLADTAGVFLNTLTSTLMKRMMDGLFNLSGSGTSLGQLVAGATGGTVAGKSIAEEMYAEFIKPSFISSGVYNVMNDFVTCPPDPTVYNCVVDSSLQTAIDNKWTVQEFVDYLNDTGVTYQFAHEETNVPPSTGLTLRSIQILRKFRVVPVGWQIAAEYINSELTLDPNDQINYTLPEVVDLFDNVGDPGGEDYRPLGGLVASDWVLKAPENYCAKEAFTDDILYYNFTDDDMNSYTQDSLALTRNSACVDERACIQENTDGTCSAYGYCTKEKRIYRFEGDQCEEQNASCQSFLDEDGETVSYLKSSVNYDDCAGNPGCKWYCGYKDTNGTYLCLDDSTSYVTCVDSTSPGYNKEEICNCSETETCQVPTASDCNVGTDPDCDNSCTIPATDPAYSDQTCYLSDNCGADYPTYDPAAGTCTCSFGESCEMSLTESTCDLSWTQCDLGETCIEDGTGYGYTEYCTCTEAGETCEVGLDDYSCENATQGTCILDTNDEENIPDGDAPPNFNEDVAINFDNDVEECDAEDVSCHLYYRLIAGTNLVSNANMSLSAGVEDVDGANGDSFGWCSDNGDPCFRDSECGSSICLGWKNPDGAEAIYSANANITPEYGSYVLELGGTHTITNTIDTGRALDNRTFTISIKAYSDIDTTLTYTISSGSYSASYAEALSASTWLDDMASTFTFPDENPDLGSDLTITITGSSSGEIYIDLVHLEESDSLSGLADYGSQNDVHLLTDSLTECEQDDVGCESYTPVRGDEEDAIPGIITNPNSDVCNTLIPYSNPDCSQCSQSMVGCDFYQEQPLADIIPLPEVTASVTDQTEIEGIRKRTGYYCEYDSSISCDPNEGSNPCSSGACVLDISIIPSSGESCSASNVGCEEYTNLDAVAAGGEGLEYYSYLQQCVNPSDPDAKTFYTWVGSDVQGYQLRSYLLKSNNGGAPCTNLDPEFQDYNASCLDNIVGADDCQASFGIDPDCRQYYDDDGDIW